MKRFRKIIFSICFILAFIFSINIKLFASSGFEIDNNGNIESLNLFNANTNITYGNGRINKVENTYIIENNTNGISWQGFRDVLNTLTNNENYTITILPTSNYTGDIVQINNNFIEANTPYTFVKTANTTGGWIRDNVNISFNVMLNKGTNALDYFPYGTYYNSTNTLNNNTYLSPFNIDYVESETFYINDQLQQGEEPVGYGGTYLYYDIEHTNAQNQNNWKSIINFNRMIPSITILFKPTGNNIYSISVYKNEELINYIPVRYNENLEESDYYFTLPEFNRIELYCDIVLNTAPNQEIILANTYEQGYLYGYSNGYNQGYAEGESSSYGSGYATGYQKGIREANQNSLYNMILAIVDTPIHIFKGIFDFNVLGINLTNFVLSLISILIVVWLLKFFL